MRLRPEEPAAGPWCPQPVTTVVDRLTQNGSGAAGRPYLLGIDGRSSSGKTSLAARLLKAVGDGSIVHTDDVAWHHSIFGWDDLLLEGILTPLRDGQGVHYRPPAWNERSRPGAIEVPGDCLVVIVEGVGTGRRELRHLLDALVWVQADQAEIERREAQRVADGEVSTNVQEAWLREEIPFLAHQRPWEHADLVVAGTPEVPHDLAHEIVVADPPHRAHQ